MEKGWNPRLPHDSLKKDLINIHPTAASFKLMIDKARKHATTCMQNSFDYNKKRWDKTHKDPEFKIGDLVLVSTTNFNSIKGSKKLKGSFAGPFVVRALHGKNAVEVVLTEELERKHPTFPVSLIKPYKESDKEKFPLRSKMEVIVPPLEQGETKKISKVLKEKRIRENNKKLYLVRYKNQEHEDEWLEETAIPDNEKLLRKFRADKRTK